MKIRWTPGLGLLVLMAVATAFSPLAAAELEWRVSIKVVLDADGNRASEAAIPGGADLNDDSEIYGAFDLANQLLDTYGRGYHFKVVEITNLHDLPPPPTNLMCCLGGDRDGFEVDTNGCPGGITNTYSHWFDVPSFGAGKKLYEAVTNEPARFAWRTDALNVYILGSAYSGTGGKIGGQPVVLGQNLTKTTTPFHEMGHTFGLDHTHGGGGGSDDPSTVGDDGICDTLLDNSYWNSNTIAFVNFGSLSYDSLTEDGKRQVDETYNNLMSYHPVRQLLTQGQLDVMTDSSNGAWPSIVNGRTWFVDAFAGGCTNKSTQSGRSDEPYHTVAGGLAAADSGDIVLIRQGYYNEQLTISQPVTLRTPRSSARIGSPR